MRPERQEILRDYENLSGEEFFETLLEHFDEFDRWDDTEIADEASRVYRIIFQEDIEDDSPFTEFIRLIASAASSGVFSAFAYALDIDKAQLQIALSKFQEFRDSLPPPVSSLDELMKMGIIDD